MRILHELSSSISIKPVIAAIVGVPLLFGAVSLLGASASAQTAEGETPADEVFCDAKFDGKLDGLRNAFCEATDCGEPGRSPAELFACSGTDSPDLTSTTVKGSCDGVPAYDQTLFCSATICTEDRLLLGEQLLVKIKVVGIDCDEQ